MLHKLKAGNLHQSRLQRSAWIQATFPSYNGVGHFLGLQFSNLSTPFPKSRKYLSYPLKKASAATHFQNSQTVSNTKCWLTYDSTNLDLSRAPFE